MFSSVALLLFAFTAPLVAVLMKVKSLTMVTQISGIMLLLMVALAITGFAISIKALKAERSTWGIVCLVVCALLGPVLLAALIIANMVDVSWM